METLRLNYLNNYLYQNYLILKQSVKLLNSVYGTNITLFVVETVLYYAVSLDKKFGQHFGYDRDWTKIVLFLYSASTCLVLIAAADIPKQVRQLVLLCWTLSYFADKNVYNNLLGLDER